MSQHESWDQAKEYGKVVAHAWRDEAFKQRLIADPIAVLAAEGIEVPAGQQVRVVENTGQLTHLVLPVPPGELSDDELDQAAGGVCNYTSTTSHMKCPVA